MALLTKVKSKLAVHAHRTAHSLLDGQYKSFQSGRSLDFQDLREYVVGDDVKDLDWKASARTGELLIRRYHADRKHTVQLCVAVGKTFAALAEPGVTKGDVAIQAAGMLAYLALNHGDYVGLIVSDGTTIHSVRPSTTQVALERMLQHIQTAVTSASTPANLTDCLRYVADNVRRRTILLVVMDDDYLTEADLALFKRLRAQHEVLVVSIGDIDPSDPRLSRDQIVDVLTGDPLPAFVHGDAQLHAEIDQLTSARVAQRSRSLQRLAIAHEHVTGTDSVMSAVFRLLERHRHVGA